MCGIPGSGKTTWVNSYIKNPYTDIHISCDKIRFNMLEDNDEYFSHEDSVFKEFVREAQGALDNDVIENIYLDATHITKGSRNKILHQLYIPAGTEVIAVVFHVPFEICWERNASRTGRQIVPYETMMNMYKNFTIPNLTKENFDYIWIVNEKNEIEKGYF